MKRSRTTRELISPQQGSLCHALADIDVIGCTRRPSRLDRFSVVILELPASSPPDWDTLNDLRAACGPPTSQDRIQVSKLLW